MRAGITLILLVLLVLPVPAVAQSRTVSPDEVALRVEVEETAETPLEHEMIMIRILGTYRRHITREALRQPDLSGFNWSQLGPDRWWEERVGGRMVKRFERRMALYPDEAGTLTVGAFTHNLTLTDESDDWFEYPVRSEPFTIEVAPAPRTDAWWFPVRRLRISDKWSNAPDQLAPGEGVLRIVQVEALGVTPEMIPPMPELTSPSAMIFAHPEKRLVDVSPEGPVTRAFWRWTIRPTNDLSTIVEPITFSYFDTTERRHREVVITPQRVAYGDRAAPDPIVAEAVPTGAARLPGWWVLALGAGVFAGGVYHGLAGRKFSPARALRRFAAFDPLRRRLRRAARSGNARDMRRALAALIRRDGPDAVRLDGLGRLDRAIFAPGASPPDLKALSRRLCTPNPRAGTNG